MTADDMIVDDSFSVIRLNMCIVHSVRVNCYDRSLLAEAETSGLYDLDFF